MMDFCFAVEKPLGRLAKWLRILGFDTLYEPDLPEGSFNGLEPERILLTQRTPIRQERAGQPQVVIRSDHYWEQLLEVVRAAGITAGSIRPFSRCICCNSEIKPAAKADVQGKVPDYVWETHAVFRICPGCRRIYWSGSHLERSMARIRSLFNGQPLDALCP